LPAAAPDFVGEKSSNLSEYLRKPSDEVPKVSVRSRDTLALGGQKLHHARFTADKRWKRKSTGPSKLYQYLQRYTAAHTSRPTEEKNWKPFKLETASQVSRVRRRRALPNSKQNPEKAPLGPWLFVEDCEESVLAMAKSPAMHFRE